MFGINKRSLVIVLFLVVSLLMTTGMTNCGMMGGPSQEEEKLKKELETLKKEKEDAKQKELEIQLAALEKEKAKLA